MQRKKIHKRLILRLDSPDKTLAQYLEVVENLDNSLLKSKFRVKSALLSVREGEHLKWNANEGEQAILTQQWFMVKNLLHMMRSCIYCGSIFYAVPFTCNKSYSFHSESNLK